MDQQQHAPREQRGLRPFVVAGLIVVGAVAAVAGVRVAFSPAPYGNGLSSSAPPVGRPAPDVTLPLFSGGTLDIHRLRGRPIVLNFWASWCVPCRSETPLLVSLHQTYGPRGIVFAGVDVEDQERDARAFIAEFHVDYLVARAPDEKAMDAYSVVGVPTTVFIGADGVVVDAYAGGFVGSGGAQALKTRLD
ncbi:MAG: TlpA family protein disulfide reductase, partial [Bacillati bacterium ANGP1]